MILKGVALARHSNPFIFVMPNRLQPVRDLLFRVRSNREGRPYLAVIQRIDG